MPSASTLRRMELSDVMVVAEWCVDVTALTFLGKSNEKLDLGGSLTCWILHSLRLRRRTSSPRPPHERRG